VESIRVTNMATVNISKLMRALPPSRLRLIFQSEVY
jgi:hypothetical protein